MTAPRWIAEALDVALNASDDAIGRVDYDGIATALLERLPLEAIACEVPRALDDIADGMHGRVVADIMRVLTDGDPDVATLTELYQGASKALDAAGVPYAVNTAELYRPLDLAGRIQWLAQQRPTRLDLQRAEAERDAARERVSALEGEVEILGENRDAATGESEHSERELVNLRRRFDDLQRDRDRLARDLNQMQSDLDTAERKLRDAERDLTRARHPGSW